MPVVILHTSKHLDCRINPEAPTDVFVFCGRSEIRRLWNSLILIMPENSHRETLSVI